MLSFENDYSRAAHPAVLEAVAEANNHLYSGYGSDELSDQAKAKIREACGQPDADVWFLVGGTQTNQSSSTPSPRRMQAWSRSPPAIRTCTRPAPSSSPGTRCSRFPSTTAKWTRPNWTSSARPSMRTATTSTWCSRAPCTSRKAPNMAPSTPRPSCRPSPMWRTSTTCRCSWMARDSATR